MKKIIICDKNKELIAALSEAISEGEQPSGINLSFVCGDIINLHEKTPNSRIVTASNPSFSPDGGLDAVLKEKYEWKKPQEFSWNNDLFWVVSVNNNRQSNSSIIQRALVGVIGYSYKYTMLLTGIGTGIGGMPIEEFVRLVRKCVKNNDLSYSDLSYRDLRNSKLNNCDLSHSDFSHSDFSYSNLRFCDFSYSNLRNCNLSNSDLRGVIYNSTTAFFALSCPEEGAFIGWKKAEGKIVKLQITEKAQRSSATSRKCRCSEAKVLAIYDGKKKVKKAVSNYDSDLVYEVGKIVKCKGEFDSNRWAECSSGIHFFITREEAEKWQY